MFTLSTKPYTVFIFSKGIIIRNVVLGGILGAILFRLDMSQSYVFTITGSVFFGVAAM
jgi:hypothetical protein